MHKMPGGLSQLHGEGTFLDNKFLELDYKIRIVDQLKEVC